MRGPVVGNHRLRRRIPAEWSAPVLLGVVSILVLPGCGEDRADNLAAFAPPAKRFDAGSEAIATFTVAEEPDVTIGVVEGEVPYNLTGVTGATRLSDGTIVVANCASGELRYFDRAGRFVRSVGRKGKGPGEFSYLRRLLAFRGDTLAVPDPMEARITIFAPHGDLVRTIPLGPVSAQFLDVLGRMSDGSFVARRLDYRTSAEEGMRYRATVTLLRLDGNTGVPLDSIIDLPATDMLAPPTPGGPYLTLRLRRAAVFAVHAGGVFYGGQDEAGIIEFDSALKRVSVTETITRSEPVTQEMKNAFQEMMDEGEDIPEGGVGPANAAEYAPSMPAFGDIVMGRDGRLWVQDPIRPGHYPLIWTAYRGGEAVSRVEIPPRFFPFEFGSDWVLGVSFDDLAVERIELRRFVPGRLLGRVLPPREAEPPSIASTARCGAWASR